MIERPRGTRDLKPEIMESRRWLESKLREKAESYGYREVLTPTFEHTDLFLEKSGPSIVEEIYSFKDKGGRKIALRPEFTASVMRMFSQCLREEPKPLKLYYFGSAFRYERPQSGRYREFWHFGTELIGAGSPKADAENIALAFNSIKESGLEEMEMRISHLQILEDYLRSHDISREDREEIYHIIDKQEENEELLNKFDLDEIFFELLDAPFESIPDLIGETEAYKYLKEVLDYLSYYGITGKDFEIDLRTVRGLDYYTGVVFEIDAEKLGAEKQICGGGDYNLGDLFGIDISSKGFAIGFDRLHLALEKEKELAGSKRKGCYIIPIGEESQEYAYDVLFDLRAEKIKTDIDLKDRNIGKALGFADKTEFKYSLLIGEDEVKNKKVALKDMDTGEQIQIDKDKIVDEVKSDG